MNTLELDTKESYWSAALKEFELKSKVTLGTFKNNGFKLVNDTFSLDKKIMQSLSQFANTYNVNVNSILYSAWGLLLHNYNDTDYVVFGTSTTEGKFYRFVLKLILILHQKQIRQIENELELIKLYKNVTEEEIFSYNQLDLKSGLFGSIFSSGESKAVLSEYLEENEIEMCFEIDFSLKCSISYNDNLFDNYAISKLKEHFNFI
ncbi:Amino acid adenylation domain-containing protein OS=Lysinibacillus sphaericus OX=1421 GN=LS41612_16615 PE=3 SV=1 [Lysinibacillus sphaericus]